MDLFESSKSKSHLALEDGSAIYIRDFLAPPDAQSYFEEFFNYLEWQQHDIKIFGKSIPQPRLTALYATNKKSYSYSGLHLQPNAFTLGLENLNKLIKKETGYLFTHCLANLYRDGKDSMGWHSDDEKELGKQPLIASVSLGSARKFQLKHKTKNLKHNLELEPGSLLLMQGTTQQFWKHQLPKTRATISPRINLTFRNIL